MDLQKNAKASVQVWKGNFMFNDTIAAIATPLAQSAISIIRLSGDEAIAIANSLFDKDLTQKQSHTLTYGFVMDEDKPIDEVLVSIFRAPKSYTMEDVVEINAHGGPLVTRKILELLLRRGARLARPGEFTQRAFLNGRIDLSQAEAVEDMIEASTDSARAQAIYSIRGEIKKLLEPLIDDLMDLIANIEVNIDYPEYEDAIQLNAELLLPHSKKLLARMDEILERSRNGVMVQSGIQTVIAGKPNVGKSSLLNALLEEEKAIVTEIPGTTRDLVEGRIQAGGFTLNLVDTAGIREDAGRIEQIGIEKSLASLDKADLVLLVLDGSRPLEKADLDLLEKTKEKKRVVLINKQDLEQAFDPEKAGIEHPVFISAKTHETKALEEAIGKLFDSGQLAWQPRLSNERQIGLLEQARSDLKSAKKAMEDGIETDLIEIDLVAAHDHLKEILGEVHREDLLDTLFSNFCLGK